MNAAFQLRSHGSFIVNYDYDVKYDQSNEKAQLVRQRERNTIKQCEPSTRAHAHLHRQAHTFTRTRRANKVDERKREAIEPGSESFFLLLLGVDITYACIHAWN
jgi:hypothetical protein